MEGAKASRAVEAVMLLMAMLVLQVGMARAGCTSPEKMAVCFGECFLPCSILSSSSVTQCGTKCFEKCVLSELSATASTSLVGLNRYYCHVGCATNTCSKYSDSHNPGANLKKAEGCIRSCSQNCNKRY